MGFHKSGNVISVGAVSSDKRPRSFLTHMVSVKKIPSDGRSRAHFGKPRLVEDAIEAFFRPLMQRCAICVLHTDKPGTECVLRAARTHLT